jgi:hypothetical protein
VVETEVPAPGSGQVSEVSVDWRTPGERIRRPDLGVVPVVQLPGPHHCIRHCAYELRLDPMTTGTGRIDVTFRVTSWDDRNAGAFAEKRRRVAGSLAATRYPVRQELPRQPHDKRCTPKRPARRTGRVPAACRDDEVAKGGRPAGGGRAVTVSAH